MRAVRAGELGTVSRRCSHNVRRLAFLLPFLLLAARGAAATADLSIQLVEPFPRAIGGSREWTVTVTNNGPDATAFQVVLDEGPGRVHKPEPYCFYYEMRLPLPSRCSDVTNHGICTPTCGFARWPVTCVTDALLASGSTVVIPINEHGAWCGIDYTAQPRRVRVQPVSLVIDQNPLNNEVVVVGSAIEIPAMSPLLLLGLVALLTVVALRRLV